MDFSMQDLGESTEFTVLTILYKYWMHFSAFLQIHKVKSGLFHVTRRNQV